MIGAESIGIGADFDGALGQVNISSILMFQNFCLHTLRTSTESMLEEFCRKLRFLKNLNTNILHIIFFAMNNIVVLSAQVNTLYNI